MPTPEEKHTPPADTMIPPEIPLTSGNHSSPRRADERPPERSDSPWWKVLAAVAGGAVRSLVDWYLRDHPHH